MNVDVPLAGGKLLRLIRGERAVVIGFAGGLPLAC